MMRGLRTGGRIVRLGAMFLALVMALTLVPATAFAAGIEDYITFTNSKKGSQDLDYIIVLGAQVREDGPSVVLKYRLDAAVDYLNGNPEHLKQ